MTWLADASHVGIRQRDVERVRPVVRRCEGVGLGSRHLDRDLPGIRRGLGDRAVKGLAGRSAFESQRRRGSGQVVRVGQCPRERRAVIAVVVATLHDVQRAVVGLAGVDQLDRCAGQLRDRRRGEPGDLTSAAATAASGRCRSILGNLQIDSLIDSVERRSGIRGRDVQHAQLAVAASRRVADVDLVLAGAVGLSERIQPSASEFRAIGLGSKRGGVADRVQPGFQRQAGRGYELDGLCRHGSIYPGESCESRLCEKSKVSHLLQVRQQQIQWDWFIS